MTVKLALCCDRWNPAVEQQAQDRIHRLGQYKPIHVTRFVIAGSIEERILKLQVRYCCKVHSHVDDEHAHALSLPPCHGVLILACHVTISA